MLGSIFLVIFPEVEVYDKDTKYLEITWQNIAN